MPSDQVCCCPAGGVYCAKQYDHVKNILRCRMKTVAVIAVSLLLSGVLAGCGTASRAMQEKFDSGRMDVFDEVHNGDAISPDFSELTIRANIKTHTSGYYIFESKESPHGKEKYPFLINIDGQAVRWDVDGAKEIKPAYDSDGKTSRDPEAREGLKYILEKKVRLIAGTHKVFFGLPADKYFTEVEISLKKGETSTLEFKPIYRTKRIPSRIPTFLKGIYRYEVFLNGELLPK
jgi:hypothetical protein